MSPSLFASPLPRAYVMALVCFLALDACWLAAMGARLYQPLLGALMAPQVDWLAAALLYPVYIGGLVHFAVRPALVAGRSGIALRQGVLVGLLTYATYDLTNQATLLGWPWVLTLADIAWGAFASGTAAFAAAFLTFQSARRKVGR